VNGDVVIDGIENEGLADSLLGDPPLPPPPALPIGPNKVDAPGDDDDVKKRVGETLGDLVPIAPKEVLMVGVLGVGGGGRGRGGEGRGVVMLLLFSTPDCD
jgi:hypothetical protein